MANNNVTKRVFVDSRNLEQLADSELIALVEMDIPEAFQVLVDRYHKLVRSVAARVLSDDPMATEDAVQESFLKALTRIKDLRDRNRFKSWICAIARNQSLDVARRRKRIVSWETTSEDGTVVSIDIPDPDANPSDIHDRTEVACLIQDILSEIPDMYRTPITLRFEDDLEYGEIAKLLGKPLGTIKSLIHRGKALIKREITRRAWGSDGAQVIAS